MRRVSYLVAGDGADGSGIVIDCMSYDVMRQVIAAWPTGTCCRITAREAKSRTYQYDDVWDVEDILSPASSSRLNPEEEE